MSMIDLLPMMEAVYKSKGKTFFKYAQSSDKGMYVIAKHDIVGGAVVHIETALHVQPRYNHPSIKGTAEYESIHSILDDPKENPSGHDGTGYKTSAAWDAIDRLAELNATAYMAESPKKLNEIWELEDSHRHAKIGDSVMIAGLASAAGKKLNGKCGRVSQQDENDPNRLGVEVAMGGNSSKNKYTVMRSIKPCNLKTLGGIMRTNAYHDASQDSALLFRELCRVNHACGDSANVYRTIHNGKGFLTAKTDIPAGNEILVDYLPTEEDEKEGDRLEKLYRMFNFRCHCPAH